jgi:hypothetical protein
VEGEANAPRVRRAGLVRTARALFDGIVFAHEEGPDRSNRQGSSTPEERPDQPFLSFNHHESYEVVE